MCVCVCVCEREKESVPVPCVETAGVAVTPTGRKPHAFSCLPSHNSRGHLGPRRFLSASGSEKQG